MNERVSAIVSRLEGVDPDTLKRTGVEFFNFEDIGSLLDRTFEYVEILRESPEFVDGLTPQQADQVFSRLAGLVERVLAIRDYTPTGTNPQESRDQLARAFSEAYAELYEPLFVPLQVHRLNKYGAAGELQSTLEYAQRALQQIEDNRDSSDAILEAQKEASAETGVASFAKIFGEQATHHEDRARTWLIASVLLSVVFAGVIWWVIADLLNRLDAPEDVQGNVQFFLTKLLLVLVASGVLYQVFRQFSIQMHLFTLNKHRENCLTAFRAFYEATDDPQVKDSVLIQATRAIFEAGDTGYVGGRDAGHPNVIEITRVMERLGQRSS
ncbi:MAG: hypothetical protein ABR505_11905 [Actinomycetota bacterium]